MGRNTPDYADFIRNRRTAMHFKQREIANACGVTDSAIAHIERGIRLPSSKVLTKIAAALGLNRDEESTLFEMVRQARDARAGYSKKQASVTSSHRIVTGRDVEFLDSKQIERDLMEIKGLNEAYLNLRDAMRNPRTHMAVMMTLEALAKEARSDLA